MANRSFSAYTIKLGNFLRSELVKTSDLNEAGQFIRGRIYQFTKSGRSIAGREPKRLKELSSNYVDFRRKYKGPVGENFSPKRSNLTLTGQLLDALTYSIDPVKKIVKVFVANSSRNNSNISNKTLAEFVSEQGRAFMGLDTQGWKRVISILQKNIRQRLRKNLTSK